MDAGSWLIELGGSSTLPPVDSTTQRRRFKVRHLLGRGGFGEVYRATMTSPGGLEAEVAVKLLREESARADAVRRLRDEGRFLSALHHPAILRAWDLAVLDGRVALVTEYVEGQDLAACIRPGDPDRLPVRALLEAIAQTAEGLEAAFTTNQPGSAEPLRIVHRDVKPSNLRIGPHGQLKILDFGIARSDSAREAKTASNSTLGSLAYMAPERFGREAPGPESDVYSLGCVLYEGLTGHRLHPDAVPIEMVTLASDPSAWTRHVEAAFTLVPADVPTGVRTLLRAMLAHAPSDRPTTRAVAATCEDVASALPGPTLKRWARERQWPPPQVERSGLDGRSLTDDASDTGSKSGSQSETYHFTPAPVARHPDLASAPVSTVEQPVAAVERAVAPPPSRATWGVVAGVVVLALVLGAAALWSGGTPPTPPPLPRPTPASTQVAPAPLTPVAPVVPVEPRPAPVDVAPERQARPVAALPRVAPDPRPQPSPEPPAPAAAPAPAVVQPGIIKVVGATLTLVEVDGVPTKPTAVPADRDSMVTVDFGPNTVRLGPYRVRPGGALTIRCVHMTQECTVD